MRFLHKPLEAFIEVIYTALARLAPVHPVTVFFLPWSQRPKETVLLPISKVYHYWESDPWIAKSRILATYRNKEEQKKHIREPTFKPTEASDPRTIIHETVRLMFLENKKFHDTPQYQHMKKAIDSGRNPRGCKTKEDIEQYMSDLYQLHRSILQNGVLPVGHENKAENDDIRIIVDRNGMFGLGSKGNHRFRIAEICGHKSVPVNIFAVNREFLTKIVKQTNQPPHDAIKWHVYRQTVKHN